MACVKRNYTSKVNNLVELRWVKSMRVQSNPSPMNVIKHN